MAHDKAYYQAEKKIEQALKSGARELNLSEDYDAQDEKKLTELPESIWQLVQLQKLSLYNNRLTTLPMALGKLTQLQKLNLTNNQLTTLPTALGKLTQLTELSLSNNQLTALPDSLGQLTLLQSLILSRNGLTRLPVSLGKLTCLLELNISENLLTELPEWVVNLANLQTLYVSRNHLFELPEFISELNELVRLNVSLNNLKDLPSSFAKLKKIKELILLNEYPRVSGSLQKVIDVANSYSENPINPELAAAYKQGIEAVKLYLRAGAVVPSYEAKLILVGEGEVGKTCLMDALLDRPWQNHPSTHGIEIQSFKVDYRTKEEVIDASRKIIEEGIKEEIHKEITLNSWDFGGQRVYRPTHQLFFSAPAVYLVVWKPREGSQAGQVKEWIQLVKRREPSAKILVVATHGGPQQRQPDIDRQELWDLFGKETVVDFFFVESKPDEHGNRKGIDELKRAIASVAASLPEVGRSVPKSFADVRQALQAKGAPYLPLREVLDVCRAHNMDDEIARLFITISHRLGHLTHYENDPTLRDIVILRPDWLATAMSYVLDDEATRTAHGLVKFSRLAQLWDDPTRPADTRYPDSLHRIFLKLMGRFDLSYPVPALSPMGDSDPQSLIAQFVPDNRPQNYFKSWLEVPSSGDLQQTQICRIADDKGNTAAAEGLFYQLIVRLHKYSLGRVIYADSVHWQRGLVLDDDYNGRALLEHKGNDVHITVRAPYPERFLAMLTEEVRYLVESFWEGLRCEVTVPCLNPQPCIGLFEVSKLMENIKRGRPEQPCPVCNEWQSIDKLLHNAPAASKPISIEILEKQLSSIENKLDTVDINVRRIRSQADKNFDDLIHLLTDEAKEGPRLFSFFPVDRSAFNPKTWIREKFRLVLWCEHSRLPLPVLNNGDMKKGVYDLELDREWFKKSAPYLKFLTGTLGMVLPVASSAVKLALDETAYKLIEEQLDFGKSIIDATLGETAKIGDFLGTADSTSLEHGVALRSDGETLRELHALLKAKDPGFGGLVRVMNKRQEFLWVHEKFAGEY